MGALVPHNDEEPRTLIIFTIFNARIPLFNYLMLENLYLILECYILEICSRILTVYLNY